MRRRCGRAWSRPQTARSPHRAEELVSADDKICYFQIVRLRLREYRRRGGILQRVIHATTEQVTKTKHNLPG